MPEMRLAHVSLLVRNRDEAVERWRKLLRILDPSQAERITYGEGVEGGEHMRWATFVSEKPNGCQIQLFEALPEGGFLRKTLDKRGEIVHHVAFLSSDADRTIDELRETGVPLV